MSGNKRILVVDDEPSLLEFLDVFLSLEGYCVESAANGKEAVRLASVRDYDAVITDIRMPVMDGIDFYKNLRAVSPELVGRVIFMSGYLKPDYESFIKGTGCPFLLKPFQIRDLSNALAAISAGPASA